MGVRKESVELSLNDVDFTSGMAKSAAMTALLNKELRDLDGSSTKANTSTTRLADDGIKKTGTQARSSSDDLNKYTGRMNALVQATVALGPALIPVTAGLIPAVTGVAAGIGAAASAVGVAVLAFHGMGDALTALNTYQLQPTAAHLQALNDKMASLGPSGQAFARFIAGLEPDLRALQESAQAGLFPGMREGITALLPLLPQVEQLVGSIASEMGNLTAKAGHGLANDSEFQAFFHYLQTDAAPTLDAFAKATGNVAAGLAQMTVDFAPVNRDFADGLVHASESFRQWSDGLAQSQGFHEFVGYIEQEGPKVINLLEALGSAAFGIVKAAQPVGQVVLPVLTALLNVIGAIGKSPLGPPIYAGVVAAIAFEKAGTAMSGLLTRLGLQTAALSAEMRGLAGSVAQVDAASSVGGSKFGGFGSLKAGLIGGGTALASYLTLRGSQGATLGLTGLSHPITNAGAQQEAIVRDLMGTQSWTSQINPFRSDFDPLAGFSHSIDRGLGLFGIGNASTSMHKQLSSASDVLAGMVQNGQGAQAAKDFEQISEAAKRGGVSVGVITKAFTSYRSAASAAGVSTNAATAAQQKSTQAALAQAAALKSSTDAALGAFGAETSYRQALASAEAQAKKSNAGFKGMSDAVIANRTQLQNLAGQWNAQIQAMAANGASMDRIRAKYRTTRQDVINVAMGMGATAAEAKRYADRLLQIPKTVATSVTADTANALASIRALQGYLNDIPRNVHVNVTASTNANLADISGINGPRKKATGGAVFGPGTSTSDSIPAYLSNGEYVMRAAAVQKYGVAMFDHLNAMHFAKGGPVRSYTDTNGSKSYYVPLGAKNVDWAGAHKYADAERALDKVTKALDALTKSAGGVPSKLDAATSALDALKADQSSLMSSVTSGLTPDIFAGPSGGVFSSGSVGGTFASAMAALTKQGNNADAFLNAEQTLTGKGLSGPALTALLGTGNLSTVQNFASQSASDLAAYSKSFDSSTSKVNVAATYAGNAGYGAQITAQTAVLKSIEARVAQLQAQQTRDQNKATREKQALSAKQAKQIGQHVAKAHDHVAKRARNK